MLERFQRLASLRAAVGSRALDSISSQSFDVRRDWLSSTLSSPCSRLEGREHSTRRWRFLAWASYGCAARVGSRQPGLAGDRYNHSLLSRRVPLLPLLMASPSESPDAEDRSRPATPPSEPQILHFGLRQWFYFISGVVIFCALLARLETVGALVLASVVALIAAHIVGTVLGTKLRDTSGEVSRWKARPGSLDADRPVAVPQPVSLSELRLPETTTLAGQGSGVGRTRLAAAIGAVLGLVGGAAAIARFAGPDVTAAGVALGAVSCGVIGAWLALLTSNFWAIAREAWRHAHRHD